MRYLPGIYVNDVKVQVDGEERTLNVWRNPESGRLVALENLELPVDVNSVQDPYDPEVRLSFADTFSGLPK